MLALLIICSGKVTAADIGTVGDVQVLNPNLVICTLDDGVKLGMEFTVNLGKGYQPSSVNRPEDAPIGLIPVDSIYSPVRRVSYSVAPTRVGQVTEDIARRIQALESSYFSCLSGNAR